MADTGKAWVLFHATETKPGWYAVAVWLVDGEEEDEPTSKQRRGYPAADVAAVWMKPKRDFHSYSKEAIEALWLPPKSHVTIIDGSETWEEEEIGIVAYVLHVDFSPDDAQSLADHGLDPETSSAEDFYDATGEWPDSTAQPRVDAVLVPSMYRNILADVRSLQDDGWAISQIVPAWADIQAIAANMQEEAEKIFRTRMFTRKWTMADSMRKTEEELASRLWLRDDPATMDRWKRELY